MKSILKKIKNETVGHASINRQENLFILVFIMVVFVFSLTVPSLTNGAQKKIKTRPKPKPTVVQKNILVNDANILVHQKRVEDLVEKGDFENAVKIMLKMNDYSKEVLSVAKAIKVQYEASVGNPQISQDDKEDLFFKLKGLNRLISRYTDYYEASTFNLGYIYARLHDTEKARKYLVEFLQKVPYYSGNPESQWIKAKMLLLELYNLEGEF